MRVVVGLSGGVDSSVAAWLLKEQGHDVVGLFMQNWHDTTGTLSGDCPWADDRMMAEMVARKLDIPFHEVDLSEQYRARVVEYMFDEYARGRTPNPDVLCNREIKFGVFLQEALKLGAERVATGHYCRRGVLGTEYRLLKGLDGNKDQSYFLCQLTQEQLGYAMFPIGDLIKPEVRRIAAEQGLATATRKDSQGICFVGKVDLPVFLQQKLAAKEGDIVEIPVSHDETATSHSKHFGHPQAQHTDGHTYTPTDDRVVGRHDEAETHTYTPSDGRVIGRHNGAHFYTIGQRRGLAVGGHAEPLFVLATDVSTNTIYVGEGQNHPGLYRRTLRVDDLHWIRPSGAREGAFQVRIRYRQPLQEAILSGNIITFTEPQRGVTPGQFAALYDGDELLSSGIINY